MIRGFALPLFLFTLAANSGAQAPPSSTAGKPALDTVQHLKDFPVVELRRYIITDGGRDTFARCFDAWFPEAHEQMGSIAFGQFLERDHPNGYLWLRGFHNLDARAVVSASFYYGPLWHEHWARINDLLVDSDNILVLKPLRPETGVPVLPAVDPIREEKGAQGVAVVLIAAVQPGQVEPFARLAEPMFAAYRDAGAREAGLLTTIDSRNNFPQLPIRTDGPFVVWLGLLPDEAALKDRFLPLAQASLTSFAATGLLRGAPELIVLDPTHLSRLRWLPQ